MEKERLILTIQRFDHYYNSVNVKSSVILGLTTILMGCILNVTPTLLTEYKGAWLLKVLILLIVVMSLSTIIMLILGFMPYRKTGNSIFAFPSIANSSLDNFILTSREISDEKELQDLREQVHILAIGLQKKFNYQRIASILLLMQFVAILPITIFSLIKF